MGARPVEPCIHWGWEHEQLGMETRTAFFLFSCVENVTGGRTSQDRRPKVPGFWS